MATEEVIGNDETQLDPGSPGSVAANVDGLFVGPRTATGRSTYDADEAHEVMYLAS